MTDDWRLGSWTIIISARVTCLIYQDYICMCTSSRISWLDTVLLSLST